MTMTRRGWLVSATLGATLARAARLGAAPFVPERNAQCVAVSSDGALVATGKSGMSNAEFPPRPHPALNKCGLIQIWDTGSGEMRQRMQTFGDFTKLRFSNDRRYLASCRLFTPGDGLEMPEVQVWDHATGKSVRVLDRCHGFSWTPDGAGIAVLSRSRCVLYDVASGERRRQYESLGGSIAIEFSTDGKYLFGIREESGSFRIRRCAGGLDTDRNLGRDRGPGTGHQAADGAGEFRDSIEFAQPFYTLANSGDGLTLATGHEGGEIVMWNRDSLEPIARLQTLDKGLPHPFFSADGSIVGGGSQATGDVELWDLGKGAHLQRYTFERGTLRTYHPRGPSDKVRPERDPTRFALLPDGQTFLAGCFGGIIRSVASGQEIRRFTY